MTDGTVEQNHMKYDRRSRPSGRTAPRLPVFFFYQGGRSVHQGWVHSIESMGLVDGPGIRSVVFLQGCRLRCRYCHNPDTWEQAGPQARQMSAEELVGRLSRFRPYYGRTGGVTFSGGEPLLQREFLLEVLPLCRAAGIHVCLDTAGCGIGGYEEILAQTDLVLFDVKHITEEGYRLVTGQEPTESLRFLETAQRMGKPLWIRHVVVPGLTNGEEHLRALQAYIKTLRHVEKVELLPYHTLGVGKYEALGIPYPLQGVPPLSAQDIETWQKRFDRELQER